MKKLNDIFALYVKLGPFCKAFTKIDPAKGLYHRIKGYNTAGKPADLTEDDKEQLKAGIKEFCKQALELVDSN